MNSWIRQGRSSSSHVVGGSINDDEANVKNVSGNGYDYETHAWAETIESGQRITTSAPQADGWMHPSDDGANLRHRTKRRNKILADDGQVNTQPPSLM
jgi:hypothetical protein